MTKTFDAWNIDKKRINTKDRIKFYNTREIWWCALGMNIGCEQDGSHSDFQRPVLILRGLGPNTCLVVPLTTSSKRHRFRISVGIVAGKNAVALISQIRVIDTKRLVNKIGFLDKLIFQDIRNAAKAML